MRIIATFRDSKSLIRTLKANNLSITQIFNANRVSIKKGQCYFIVQNNKDYYFANGRNLSQPL